MRLAMLLLLFSSVLAFAQPVSNPDDCQRNLTVPHIDGLSAEEIRELSNGFEISVGKPLVSIVQEAPHVNDFGLSKMRYPEVFTFEWPEAKYFKENVGFTSYNEPLVRNLIQASYTVLNAIRNEKNHSEDVLAWLELGALSMIQIFSQFTAEPIDGVRFNSLIDKIMRPRGRKPSLIIEYATVSPNHVFDPNSTKFYFRNSLHKVNRGALEMNADYRAYLHWHRKLEGEPRAHGYPIAPFDLQYFLDAIVKVYLQQR